MRDLKSSVVLYSGFLLAFMGLAGIFTGFEPLASFAAPLLWWGYIALSDSLLLSLKGESLIVSRTDDFLWMASCSSAVWLVLEGLNAALGVWQYINLPAQTAARWTWYLGMGAALLPALYQSAAYLSPVKSEKRAPGTFRASEKALDGLQAAGIIFFFLPFFFPRLAFPLAAISLPLVLDPLNFRLKQPSLLGLLERGEKGKIAALAAAGLVCGLAGEAWLYAGGPSRVYDLGYAGGLPLMGLPLAGYAAFPFLAFAAFSLYSLALFARGEGIDLLGHEINSSRPRPAWLPPAAYALLCLIYYLGFLLVDARSAALLAFLP
ncbi:MAG: hypothetical protein FD189_1241 [Elusimicrobia bacterium]|nr:MAG: hypothetical protein FD154_1636 [Elusimicrobiota bacterium]KAF0155875.1 MAG: hypothetical protein FD189_1241 [Elusimicrobiota bacterium]